MSRRLRLLAGLAPLSLMAAAGPALADDAAAVAEVSGVIVTAPRDDHYRADRIASATRTDTPLRDVPQAISVITDELIRDQSMRSMADVLRYVPGASMGQGEGHRDAPTLRGNASTADFFVDGLRDDVQYLRDLYNAERIEVLKGPNAMIFGRGGGGGVINRVTKQASWSDAGEVALSLGSYDHRRLTADVDRRLSDAWSARLVGVYEDSGSYRDDVTVKRVGLNPTLGWRNAAGLTVNLGYERFEDERTVDRGAPSFRGRPSPAPSDAFFGDPDQSYSDARVDVLTGAVEYVASSGLVVRNRTLLGAYDKFYQNVYPSGAAVADAAGRPATYPLAAYNNLTERENLFNQTDLVWKAELGGREHTLLAGVELGRQLTDNRRLTGFFPGGATTLSGTPFASPTRRPAVDYRPSATDADNHVVVNLAAVYVQDQLEISERLQLIAGLRFDRFDLELRNNRNGQIVNRTDDLVSPRAGMVYKPSEPVSIYASYSVSYLPSSGDQFGSLNATSETLEPEEFENLEVGLKWAVTPDLLLTAAAYRLDRDNTTAPDPLRPGQITLTGSQRSQGLELGLSGRITPVWEVAGGYGWQEAEITSTTAAAPAGRRTPLTPEHTFALWNKYEFTPAFAGGLGIVHQSEMFASVSNAVTLPGFTRVDAALYWRATPTLRVQVNVENLFDEGYFPTSHGDHNILPGSPRAARVLLSAAF